MQTMITRALLALLLGAAALPAAEWKLVWSDDFNGQGLPDKSKWDYEYGFIRNHELQFYTRERAENARLENGLLILEGRKEHYKNPSFKPGAKDQTHRTEFAGYTSASLNTLGRAGWLYGRFEIRARLPHGKGVWPAFWMMGTNFQSVGWPKCGEIDIMEFVGKEPDKIHGTVHFPGPSAQSKHTSKGGKITTAEPFNDFHVYAVEWFADRMDFYFDQEKYFTFTLDAAGAGPDNPFRKPHFLMLNLALGGQWGGPMDDQVLPQQYQIDYVRVYQQKP